jgi:uncharacterized membrane protein YfcA
MELLAFWYLLPVGIVIAILAMSGGVSGSNFWLPVYSIWMGLEPKLAFWLSMLTMVIGFGSGITRNVLNKTINWPLVRIYSMYAGPSAILGGILAIYAPVDALLAIFSVFAFIFGVYQLHKGITGKDIDIPRHETIFWGVAIVGGLLKGLISTGLAKMLVPCLVHHKNIKHHSEAIGTTVAVVFITNIIALTARVDSNIVNALSNQWQDLLSIMIWVAPGVLIGGQIGPQISLRISKRTMHSYIGLLLILVSGLIMLRLF